MTPPELDPNYVRVLAVLPNSKERSRPWLVDAARAFLDDEPWRGEHALDDAAALLPPEFKRDKPLAAVPLGARAPWSVNFDGGVDIAALVDQLTPEKSEYFVIRGFVKKVGGAIPRRLDDLVLQSDARISASLTCGLDRAVGSIVNVKSKLGIGQLEAFGGFDGDKVAVAMVDSGIFLQHLTKVNLSTGADEKDRMRPRPRYPLPPRPAGALPVLDAANSWKKPDRVATPPGGHRIGHGTMCAYNVLAVAPKATLLDYPSLINRPPGDHTVAGTVDSAVKAYGKLISFWIKNRAAGGPYKALVVNNSWGIFHPSEEDLPPGDPGRFIDNPHHVFHLLVWFLGKLGADVVFAAGNGGMPCPAPPFLHLTAGSIRGANAYREVLTVAGCDVNDERVGYSSQGPAVAMFPYNSPKPDLSAYTHFLGSQVFGVREPDRGTSTACPIAAGCVAALRSAIPPSATSPADLFEALRNTARQIGTPGWNRDYGYGIIDPVAAARSLGIPI